MPPSIPGYEIEERIHGSRLRCIYNGRRLDDGARIVLKTLNAEYPTAEEVAELRREFRIAQLLSDIPRVIRVHSLEAWGQGNLAIVMEPFGTSLARLLVARDNEPLPLDRFFQIALPLVKTLGAVHQRGVVHKDLVPRNVLVDEATGDIRLIDFGISSELDRERQQSADLARRLEGSLPYLSPEQTGRMNRDVDYRSDYYSLGVTFFELLSGRLPFEAESVLEWVHSHISRLPPAVTDFAPHVPTALSDILLKLMSKNAEDRYQSSYGLHADLVRCHDELVAHGKVAPFQLGVEDISRRFQIPQRLYGREDELAELIALFERVAVGHTELCLVSGYSGVGKSALVAEISKPLVRERGYLTQGKFDQFKRSEAYAAVASAFRNLILQLLAESQARLAHWRTAFLDALGPNGQLIVEPQPPVPKLPPTEAQNRFQIAFLNFVRVLAGESHPLVVFLDDLQWSDAPTLDLIQRLVTSRDIEHLFLIGAYRSNEVDEGHALRLKLDELEKVRTVRELALKPLPAASVHALVQDTVRSDPKRCRALGDLLFERAEGNPFFTTELLKSFHDEGCITFDEEAGRWEWDLQLARRAGRSGSVAEFMVANLRKLPEETQQVLQYAACIGNTFDLRTLAIICEQSMEAASDHLLVALIRHVVVPLGESYKFVGRDSDVSPDATVRQGERLNPRYRFQHDRIQQAAYALIDEDRKQAVHLSIGRLIQESADDEELQDRLIDIVGHLNEGRRLLESDAERRELAELNLRAGRKAQASSAYGAALRFLRIGLELLPDDRWTADYELTMALTTECQQCAYLTGDLDEAEEQIGVLLAHARTDLEKAEVLSTQTRQYSTLGKPRESIQAAIEGLRLLGVDFTTDPDQARIQAEIDAVQANLAGRRIEDLIEAPKLTDPQQAIAIGLLMEIFPAAFLSGSGNLFPFLVLKSVNLSLQHGNSPEAAFAYAAYGMLLCGVLDDPALGCRYGQLAVAMNDRFEDIALKSRIIYVYTMFIHHWSHHWSSMTPWFKRGIESGYQSGDLLYLAYSAQDCIIWDPRLDLETAAREQRRYLTIVRDTGYQDSYDSGTLFLQMQLNFLGRTQSMTSMNDDQFDEVQTLEGMRQRRFMTGIANYHIYKAEICLLYNRYEEALEHVHIQDEMVASSMSLPQLVRFYTVAFLTFTSLYAERDDRWRRRVRARLDRDLERMTRWAANCPENFLHLQRLMEAELAAIDGDFVAALGAYEDAAAAAHDSGFLRDEAMANERAAHYLLRSERSKAAEGYMRAARHLYARWGARRKVGQLHEQFPHLLARTRRRISVTTTTDTVAPTESTLLDSALLDLASVMKASRAISGQIVLKDLLETTMEILLENAGGQHGWFVLRQEGRLVIEARGTVVGKALKTEREQSVVVEPEGRDALLPVSVIHHVLHTREPQVLNDPAESGSFMSDPYIQAQRPQSVICVPILGTGQLEGVIYMENNLATGVFTDERVEFIKLLTAQAATSIENAKLYDEQLRLTEAQSRFVPRPFLESLDHHDIARVGLGEHVAKQMSVMFADLRGFTTLAERVGPRATIELLNRYFMSLEPQIVQHGGFIDSFAGDEIMALFDVAPEQALEAGIGMARALEAFNRRSAELGDPPLAAGIGVNTGPLVLCTVGGRERIQCTVIGDTVNLAARIESLTKRYHARFLIGQHTLRSLTDRDRFSIRMVDRVAVKGKRRAVEIHQVLDAEEPARKALLESTRPLLREVMDLYFARHFEAAERRAKEGQALDREDRVFEIFARRSRRYQQEPPPDDWAGYEILKTK